MIFFFFYWKILTLLHILCIFNYDKGKELILTNIWNSLLPPILWWRVVFGSTRLNLWDSIAFLKCAFYSYVFKKKVSVKNFDILCLTSVYLVMTTWAHPPNDMTSLGSGVNPAILEPMSKSWF